VKKKQFEKKLDADAMNMDTFVVPEMNSDDEDYVAHRTRPTAADVVSKDHVFIAHVPVPSQKEIERALIERKKQELLAKYVSEELMMNLEETKNI